MRKVPARTTGFAKCLLAVLSLGIVASAEAGLPVDVLVPQRGSMVPVPGEIVASGEGFLLTSRGILAGVSLDVPSRYGQVLDAITRSPAPPVWNFSHDQFRWQGRRQRLVVVLAAPGRNGAWAIDRIEAGM